MRFPRFNFRIAIALGLSMLCMSTVPVFADGAIPDAPTLEGSVNGSTIDLSWDVPLNTDSFMLRRSTTSAPANTSAGTQVLSTDDTSTTSYSDTGLANGTYYYSVFAISIFGNSEPGSVGPLTVNVQSSGGAAAHKRIRDRYKEIADGVHGSAWEHNDTQAPSLSDVGIFTPGTGSVLPTEKKSEKENNTATPVSRRTKNIINRLLRETPPTPYTLPPTPFKQRVCDRVLQRFSGEALERVNARLKKQFEFVCNNFLKKDLLLGL